MVAVVTCQHTHNQCLCIATPSCASHTVLVLLPLRAVCLLQLPAYTRLIKKRETRFFEDDAKLRIAVGVRVCVCVL